MTTSNPYRRYVEGRKQTHQFRQLQETIIVSDGRAERDEKNYLNFSSNDYLGLSQHPALIARAKDYTVRYGVGSTASRHITGNSPVYAHIEQRLARGKGYEAALIMNSGYQANVTVLAALADSDVAGKPVIILADRLCHHSLLQGALLSGARLIRYHHNNYNHLSDLLYQHSTKDVHIIIVSESVFGMDGDRADLDALVELSCRYEAMLYIDEAHATGLFGPDGFGFASEYQGKIHVAMGTFGKALGSFGAYIACDATLRDYLVQRCGGLIYSTALPPAVLGAIEAALELLPHLSSERAHLQEQAARLRFRLGEQNWQCGKSTTHIIPVLLGDEQVATSLAEELKKKNILLPSIRPPTVPRGASRLRISLSAAHKAEDIDQLIAAMASSVVLKSLAS